MLAVTTAELRAHLSQYLSFANQAEYVQITNKGEVIAVLCPPTQAKMQAIEELEGCISLQDMDIKRIRFERLINQ